MKSLVELRQFMNDRLDLVQVRTFCFDLGLDFENLAGQTKQEKIIELIKTCHRQERLVELLEMLQHDYEAMPNLDWAEAKGVLIALQRYNVADAEFEGQARLPVPFTVPLPTPHFVQRPAFYDLLTAVKQGQNRIVRTVGTIGTGKSTLLNQAAHELREQFPDGVIWLRSGREELDIDLKRTAAAYGRAEGLNQLTTHEERVDFIQRLLAPRQVLVILDAVEESDSSENLLGVDQACYMISTRDQMAMHHFPSQDIGVEPYSEAESLAYLKARLRGLRSIADEAAAVRLHRLVGGLPLALSVIGGMLTESPDLTIDDLNTMLEDKRSRIEGLTDWLDGRNSVAASFDLSYQTLPADLQALFRSLAVFKGESFSSAAAAAILNLPMPRVKIGLGRLNRLSLIAFDSSRGRYEMNPLIHSFALQKCGADIDRLNERAIDYFISMLTGQGGTDRLAILEQEWPNLAPLLTILFEQQSWDRLLTCTSELTGFHLGTMGFLEQQGHWSTARALLQQALQAPPVHLVESREAALRLSAAGFARLQNDRPAAAVELDRGRILLDRLPSNLNTAWLEVQWCDEQARLELIADPEKAVSTLRAGLERLAGYPAGQVDPQRGFLFGRLVSTLGRLGRLEEAQTAAEEARVLLPAEPSTARVNLLNDLSLLLFFRGDNREGAAVTRQALLVAESLKALNHLPRLWNNLGLFHLQDGQYREALTHFTRAQSLARQMGSSYYACGCMLSISQAYLRLGEDLLAAKALEETLHLARSHDFKDLEALAFSNLVDLQIETDLLDRAGEKLAQAEAIVEQLEMNHLKATLRRQRAQLELGTGRLAAGLASIDRAVDLARQTQDELELGISLRVKGIGLNLAGESAQATKAMRESEGLLRPVNEYEWARTLVALVEQLRGRPGTEKRLANLLRQAQQVFRRLEAARDLARVEALQSRIA